MYMYNTGPDGVQWIIRIQHVRLLWSILITSLLPHNIIVYYSILSIYIILCILYILLFVCAYGVPI